ncbi:4,5-DOPA dioxygenase extradiol [Nitrosospira sp. Nl5]|uniref:4,5-DOPA-extradiol-dioxygenase n=1 Tax=Nitrosospira sp. Nl5 TaxID=200120 RepID=UPI000882F851|nr:4,5-DOPA dioxygenase extradiol [Nitrosospira sp. Nl5]SCX90834.1 4,5-DOPA dioxygenase extradiol [Nitrosospira sp. Nl5]
MRHNSPDLPPHSHSPTRRSLMPAIFVGHGNPMNALSNNAYTTAWSAIGAALPRPTAILSISAHWYVPQTAVTAMAKPRTIHDFGGFPRELHRVQYPAPGSLELAAKVADLLGPGLATMDTGWGLDHGTWSVLMHIFPHADIPVVQLSIDETREAAWHYDIARLLAPLREEGVLILGSGNIVHNLHTYSWGNRKVEPYDWALRFENVVRKTLSSGDFQPLIEYEKLGQDAKLSVPTPDHYLPLLYILAQRQKDEETSFPVEGFDGGSISMLAVRIG